MTLRWSMRVTTSDGQIRNESGTRRHRPAGPVGAGDPPPPPVAKASSEAVPPTPPPAGDAIRRSVEQDFDALLADAQRERDEYLDLAKRTKADFENFRKRMTAEVQAASARGKAEVIREVVRGPRRSGAGDSGRRVGSGGGLGGWALAWGAAGLQEPAGHADAERGRGCWIPRGRSSIRRCMKRSRRWPADGVESGTVVEVMQKGYRLGEQLIRPARVVVSE